MIRSELDSVVSLPVPCGHCSKEFTQTIARLVDVATVTCPYCASVLDVDGAEWRLLRNRAKELCIGKFAPVAPVKQCS